MVPQIRRLNSIAIAREDDLTKGTAVAASTGHYIPFNSGILKPIYNYANIEPAVGRIEAGIEHHLTSQMAELTFSAMVKSDWIGHILTGLLGSVATATVDGVIEHTITVSSDAAPPAYTLFMLDDVQDDRATYGTVRKLELTCDAEGVLEADVEMVAQKIEDGSGTASFSTDHHFQGSHLSLKIEDDTADLAGGSAIAFQKVSLTIERDVIPIYGFGSDEPVKFVTGGLRISGQIMGAYEAETYRDLVKNETPKAVLIDFAPAAPIIGGGSNTPELAITLDEVIFTNHERPEGLDEEDMETLSFNAVYDLDEGTPRMIQVVLTNEEAATAYTEPA